MVLGALGVGEAPGVYELNLRRYRCRSCGSVLVVGPYDVLPKVLYGLVTVMAALARWGHGWALSVVRAQLGAWSLVGISAQGTWASVRRWAWLASKGRLLVDVSTGVSGSLRQRAYRIVMILSGAGPPAGAEERALDRLRSVMGIAPW